MGVKERRQRERQIREKEILVAAKELFVSEGYEGASIEKIAAKLELSKRTIYLYFSSKDELYYAVAKPGLDIMFEMFEQSVEPQGTGLSKFAAIGISYADFWDKFPDYRLMMHATGFIKPPMESGPRGMEFHEVSLNIIKTMTGTIEQGIRDGSIRKEVDPMTAAFCISSSLQGVLQNLDSREAELNAMGMQRKRMIFETLELFGRALADPDQDCGSVLSKMRKERGGKRQ
jgi:TetR/AcrR family transcriptional regulator